MDQGKLALLKAEMKDQENIIKKLFEDIKIRASGIDNDVIKRESLGFKLHSLYCAFEDLFEIVAGYFENTIQNKRAYHRELLRRMKLDIEGIRPPLLGNNSYKILDELRAFRHYFRHAYGYELETKKLKDLFEITLQLERVYKRDVSQFLEKLESA